MQKIQWFLFGVLVGGVCMFGALKFHVVRAQDGYHVVGKVTARLTLPYTDIRSFTVQDWKEHQDLMLAITQSDDQPLQQEAAKGALGNTIDNWIGR